MAAHPAYYAEVEGGIYTDSSNVAVRSTATGAVVATVPDPVDANHRKLFAIDVTTRDDGTFYAIYSENKSHGDGAFVIYTFKVTSAGTVTGLAAIKGGQITGQRYLGNDGGFTVSPDGSEVAVAVAASSTGSVRSALPQRVLVIDLLTGARTVWRGGLDRTGTDFNIANLSWTADGKSLVYLAQWCPQGSSTQGVTGVGCMVSFTSEQVRELSVTPAGGELNSGPVLLSPSATHPYIAQALLGPAGTELTALVVFSGQNYEVVTIAIATGRIQSVLYELPSSANHAFQAIPMHLSADGTGQYPLLVDAAGQIHGWISGGRLHALPPAQSNGEPATW